MTKKRNPIKESLLGFKGSRRKFMMYGVVTAATVQAIYSLILTSDPK